MSALDTVLTASTTVDRRAVDGLLPTYYRGRRGYRRLLGDIPLRISVSGTRGKSGLVGILEQELHRRGYRTFAKRTGTDPVSVRDGIESPIERRARPGALFDENIWEVKRFWWGGIDALVLENQATSPYTMRVFNHLFCMPHYVAIPNIRLDHVEDMGADLTRHARHYARSVVPGSTIVSGVDDPCLADVLRREAARVGADFVDAAPEPGRHHPPGFESITVVDAVLRLATGEGLDTSQVEAHRQTLEQQFRWRPSALDEIVWFPGGEINEVDSTRLVHDHLLRHDDLPTNFIAYFRSDRPGRTATFREFFANGLSEGWCRRVYMAGAGSRLVARHLRQWTDRVRVFPDNEGAVSDLIAAVADECKGEAVMTAANGVPPFPRAVAAALGE